MTKHHAKHKRKHEYAEKEAGFLAFEFNQLMNRRDKFLIIVVLLAVVALIVGAIYIVVNQEDVTEEPLPTKVVTTPYPTIPKEITSTTIMINSRVILPTIVTVKKGAIVGFFNEDSSPVTIQASDEFSSILNIGSIAAYDVPTITLEQVGTYRYFNPQNPQDIAEIVVKE